MTSTWVRLWCLIRLGILKISNGILENLPMDYIGFLMNCFNGALPCYSVNNLQGSLGLLTFQFPCVICRQMSTLLELNGQLADSNEIWKYKKQFWSLAGYSCPNWGSIQSCWPADCNCSLKVVSWENCVQPAKHSLDNFSLQCWCFICLLIKSHKIRQPTSMNRLSCLRSDQCNFLWACVRHLCKARQILLKLNLHDLDF